MLRLSSPQMDLFDSILPPELLELPAELNEVDLYLDDERFFAPFLKRGQRKVGRPTIPMDQFLRLMFLKFRYNLSYEVLVQLVSDSIAWRRFCRIGISQRVPNPSTLSKLVNRFGAGCLEELNQSLVQKMAAGRLIKARKLRVDSTATEADIEYPTDADLLEDSVRVITRTVNKLGKLGGNLVDGFRNSTRKMKRCLINIGTWLKRRTEDAKEQVDEITAEAARTTARVLRDAETVAKRAGGFIGGCAAELKGKARSLYKTLKGWIELSRRALEQTRLRLQGVLSIPDRMVSIFDPEARAIRRGVPGKPVEFGYKVRIDEVDGGVISGYAVHVGNPNDTTQIVPAVKRHMETFGRPPDEVATDRGFHSGANENDLEELGVKRASMPVRGKRSQKRAEHEKQAWFRRLQRWRAPQEATIGLLKRCFGMRRSRVRGHSKVAAWVGFGIFASNLKRVPNLLSAKRALGR